jgi:hypothetical protein
MQWALLAGVPEEELRGILQIARRRNFARNEIVGRPGCASVRAGEAGQVREFKLTVVTQTRPEPVVRP